MSQRKAAAGRKPRVPKPPPESDALEPFKIVGQLIGVKRDASGDIIAEQIMGEVVFYRAQFAHVGKIVDEAVHAAHAAASNKAVPAA